MAGDDHAVTAAGGFTASAVMELLKLLVPIIYKSLKSVSWGLKDDLKNLVENTLARIQGVIKEAERRQITDASVQEWLKNLTDIAYDIDDVFDDFSYLVLHQETTKGLPMKACDSTSVSSNNPPGWLPKIARKFKDSANNPLKWRSKIAGKIKDSSNNQLYRRSKIAGEIKDINKRLEKLQKDNSLLQSPTVTAPTTIIVYQGESNTTDVRETARHTSPGDSLIGRDDERKQIVTLLTTFSSKSEELPVISIVGMGGIGKSTLAQFVCKDESIVRCFDELIIWVYVYKNFDVNRILKEIIGQVTKKKVDSVSFQRLLDKLHENLRGKKFLLVLDDLWSEDIDKWEKLKEALTSAATEGSKILVTTRTEQVASIVRGTIDPINLKQLTEGECWSIIMNKAFAKGGAEETPQMVETGKQIAGKCGGLPLVAKTLGSLMYTKKTLADWKETEAKDVFKLKESESKIISILKLSYDNLSSQLQRCFSYCCIFPKGFKIEKNNLINLWIAEGFVQQSGEENQDTMEYDGNDCFKHLLQSSFFHDVEMYNFEDVYTVKMHDLIHKLARHVLNNYECTVLKTSDDREYNSNGRRVQVAFDAHGEISPEFRKSLSDAKKLRTIIAIQGNSPKLTTEMFLANKRLRVLYVMFRSDISKCLASISKLRHLRYLNLTMNILPSTELLDLSLNRSITVLHHLQTLELKSSSIAKLPEDIGSLKKLMYLDLGSNEALEALPDSITSLSNLETLNLNECGLKCLPEDIGALKSLRCLDISVNVHIEKLPDSIIGLDNLSKLMLQHCCRLKELPKGFGALNKLKFFSFIGTRIKELPESCNNGLNSLDVLEVPEECVFSTEAKNWMHLKHLIVSRRGGPSGHNLLKGKLLNLQNMRGGAEEAREANLKLKENITCSSLDWFGYTKERRVRDELVANGVVVAKVLEELQRHPNLRELSIKKISGRKLPSWLMGNNVSLPNLVESQLSNCSTCEELLGLGILPSLRKLILNSMENLKEWAEAPLPLTTTTVSPGPCYYPYLEVLDIGSCHDLRVVQTSTFKEFFVESINNKGLSSLLGNNLTSLNKVTVHSNPKRKFLPVEIWLPGLRCLHLITCREFQGFVRNKEECYFYLSRMTSLCRVLIHYSSQEQKPLKELQYLPNLVQMDLGSPRIAYNLPSAFSSLQEPALPEAYEEAEGIQYLDSLCSLHISGWNKGNSLPRQIELLTGLRELTLWKCYGLVVLPDWLKNISSLEKLNVHDCPQLEKTYAVREGEDFQKISHIKYIHGLGGRFDLEALTDSSSGCYWTCHT